MTYFGELLYQLIPLYTNSNAYRQLARVLKQKLRKILLWLFLEPGWLFFKFFSFLVKLHQIYVTKFLFVFCFSLSDSFTPPESTCCAYVFFVTLLIFCLDISILLISTFQKSTYFETFLNFCVWYPSKFYFQ